MKLSKNVLIQISPKSRIFKGKKSESFDWFLTPFSDYIGYLVIFLQMTLSFPKRKNPGKILYFFNSQTGQTGQNSKIIDFLFKGGPQIVRILGSQGIVLLINRTKRRLALSTWKVLLKRLFFEKKRQKNVLYRGIYTI